MLKTFALLVLAVAIAATACASSVDVAYTGNSPNNFMGSPVYPAYLALSGGIGKHLRSIRHLQRNG